MRSARYATQAFLLLAIATVYKGLSRTGVAKFGGIGGETLRDWEHRFNKEALAGLINPKTEKQAE